MKPENMTGEIPKELFLDLRNELVADSFDFGVITSVVEGIRADPLTNTPPYVVLMYDSKYVSAIMPPEARLHKNVISRQFNNRRVVQIQHTYDTYNTWGRFIMEHTRLRPRTSAWSDLCTRGNSVWNLIENAADLSIRDPNKDESDISAKPTIPNIVMAPPTVFSQLPTFSQIHDALFCVVTHEAEAHITDMAQLPWVWDENTQEFKAGKMYGTETDFMKFLLLVYGNLVPNFVNDAMSYHERYGKTFFQRDYLGELLAYALEFIRAAELAKKNSAFGYQSFLNDNYHGADLANCSRDRKRFPNYHKNYFALALAPKIPTYSFSYMEKKRVLEYCHALKKLMVGEELADKFFSPQSLALIKS